MSKLPKKFVYQKDGYNFYSKITKRGFEFIVVKPIKINGKDQEAVFAETIYWDSFFGEVLKNYTKEAHFFIERAIKEAETKK